MNDKKAIVIHRSGRYKKYLSGIQFFSYGAIVCACYEVSPHMAMPLTKDQALALLSMLREEFNLSSFRWDNQHEIPPLKLEIVDYPLRGDPEVQE